jgi:hypothetical protein
MRFAHDVAPLGMTGIEGWWEEVTCQEEGLAEVASYDFFFIADGGQVDAGVPAE